MKKSLILLVAGVSLAGGCGGGQSGDGKMRVGVLDTTRILAEMPKYKDLQSNLAREQREFQTKIQSQLPQPGADISDEKKKQLEQEVNKKRSEFQTRVNQTLQAAIKDIKDLTTQVAEEKHLDLVVVSTPFNPSVHYNGGQDVTIDVLLKLKRI
ncbi:MAG: OmpH family outer membrane protein [Candidatus Eremiobacteraeota bacterium]|nr:OmpH family outer membrane protein [Candidatus Eremiobacteraeota bacterium]MCW5868509.1 OmpH family outer membrane protein [Candidatus Eremiobacteraeota bacterium]